MEQYLIDINPELANDLLLRSEHANKFSNQPFYWKKEFLFDVIDRCQPYLEEFKDGINVEKDDPENHYYPWLPNLYKFFLDAFNVYEGETRQVFLGWHHEHGEFFQWFEFEGETIMVSYYSDGHPQKEFRHEWDFAREDSKKYTDQLLDMEVTHPDKIVSIGESILKILPPKEDGI